MKKIGLLVAGFVAGSLGLAFAQSTPADSGAVTPSVSTKMEAHPRIYEVRDRMKNQRERIEAGLKDQTLTKAQAKACRDVLKSVVGQMRADYKTNGSKKLTEDQTADLNKLLDANSDILHEEKAASEEATAVPTTGSSM